MTADVRSASRFKGICSSPTGSGPKVGTTSERPAVSANWNTESTNARAAAATATSPENARRRRSSSPARAAERRQQHEQLHRRRREDGHRFASSSSGEVSNGGADRSTWPWSLNMARTTARATQISAAAMVMMKSVSD